MVLLLGYPGVGTAAVLGTIEDLAPTTNSYVFTNVLEDDDDGAAHYEELRSLALRRGSLFVPVVLDCDVDEHVRRIDRPDRRARLKGSDPEGYRQHRRLVRLVTVDSRRHEAATRHHEPPPLPPARAYGRLQRR
jgi:hypothetical protein